MKGASRRGLIGGGKGVVVGSVIVSRSGRKKAWRGKKKKSC